MSFAGFVFDMIRRDKENRNLRLLRRERLNERLDKMHKGHGKDNQTYPAKGIFRAEVHRADDVDYYGNLYSYCVCIDFHIYPLIP